MAACWRRGQQLLGKDRKRDRRTSSLRPLRRPPPGGQRQTEDLTSQEILGWASMRRLSHRQRGGPRKRRRTRPEFRRPTGRGQVPSGSRRAGVRASRPEVRRPSGGSAVRATGRAAPPLLRGVTPRPPPPLSGTQLRHRLRAPRLSLQQRRCGNSKSGPWLWHSRRWRRVGLPSWPPPPRGAIRGGRGGVMARGVFVCSARI